MSHRETGGSARARRARVAREAHEGAPTTVAPAIAKLHYSKEPMTLVVFQLEEVPGGTKLTITESGFDQIPLERRAKAFAANDVGWTAQTKLIERYLAS